MTIKDLHNGSVVQLRNGCNYIKVDNCLFNLTDKGGFIYVDSYNEDYNMCYHNYSDSPYDVMKFNNTYKYGHSCAMNEVYCLNEWTWEREKEVLTKEEHEYLASVIAPFRDRVTSIAKIEEKGKNEAYLSILTIDNDFACLPFFDKKEKYLNMEENKSYTLKELNL